MLRNCLKSSINPHFVHHSTRASSSNKPSQKDGINLLLYSLDRFSSSRHFQADNFAPFIHQKLSERIPITRTPHRVYEAVSNFLIHKQHPLEAVSVVQRMQKEGLMPSRLLQAQMELVALAYSVGVEEPLVEKLTKYFTSEDCTDKEFLLLFDTMHKFSINLDIIESFVTSFIDSRGPGYIADPKLLGSFVRVSIKAGELDDAFQTTTAIPTTPAGRSEARKAHIAILAALRDTGSRDTSAVNTILSSMKEKGLQPGIAVMNILLSREVRLNRRAAALRIYRLIQTMAKSDPRVRPDSYTFGTMFALYRSITPRGMRHHHGGNDTEDAYPPRALFRDFMKSCTHKGNVQIGPRGSHAQLPTLEPSSNLLTTALRVFLRHRDYAGAFVALSSFGYMNVSVDQKTWYSVLKLLIRRVWRDLSIPHSYSSACWGYAFLGLEDNWSQLHGSNTLDERVVNGILDSIARRSFSVRDPLFVPGRPLSKDEEKKYQIPTMEMMESVLPLEGGQGFVYELNPLKRLMRRALLAHIVAQGDGSNLITAKAVEAVSAEILAAKKEMLIGS